MVAELSNYSYVIAMFLPNSPIVLASSRRNSQFIDKVANHLPMQ